MRCAGDQWEFPGLAATQAIRGRLQALNQLKAGLRGRASLQRPGRRSICRDRDQAAGAIQGVYDNTAAERDCSAAGGTRARVFVLPTAICRRVVDAGDVTERRWLPLFDA